jgi:uncharacterized protein CbrC (UPF0167 family)
VIPKAERDSANTFCNSIGAEGETFSVPLYTGTTHTHYICNWLVSDAQAAEIDGYFALVFEDAQTALTSLGLTFKTIEGD